MEKATCQIQNPKLQTNALLKSCGSRKRLSELRNDSRPVNIRFPKWFFRLNSSFRATFKKKPGNKTKQIRKTKSTASISRVESIREPPTPDQMFSVVGKEGSITTIRSIEKTATESRNLSTTILPTTPEVDMDSNLPNDTALTTSPIRAGNRLFAANPMLTEANLALRLVSILMGSKSNFHLNALIRYPSVPTKILRKKYQRFCKKIDHSF